MIINHYAQRIFFIFFNIISLTIHTSTLHNQAILTCSPVELFKQNCQQLIIEPGWVIKDLLKMKINDFTESWDYIVFCLQEKQEFFTAKNRSLCKKQMSLLLKIFKNFLQSIYVKNNSEIIFSPNHKKDKNVDCISIFTYWDNQKNTKYKIFFAYMFDCIAAEFIETILNKNSTKISLQLLSDLFKIAHRYLKNSSYDERYFYHLKRYNELIELRMIEAEQEHTQRVFYEAF